MNMTKTNTYSYFLIPHCFFNDVIKAPNLVHKFNLDNIFAESLQETIILINYAIYDNYLDDFTKNYIIVRMKDSNNEKIPDLYFLRFGDSVLVKSLDGKTLTEVSYEDEFHKLKDQELFS